MDAEGLVMVPPGASAAIARHTRVVNVLEKPESRRNSPLIWATRPNAPSSIRRLSGRGWPPAATLVADGQHDIGPRHASVARRASATVSVRFVDEDVLARGGHGQRCARHAPCGAS